MTVERIVIVGDKSSKVYVTLTDAELYAAYNEQKLRFLLSDAQDRLREYCGLDGDMETNLDYEFNGLRLLLGTGCTIEDLTELGNPKCILPELAKRFDYRKNCNIDENSIWQSVIDDYFNERGWKLP